ncbi:MAG TPA: hypothetical protein VI299_09025 [Polyangiales bacterium]
MSPGALGDFVQTPGTVEFDAVHTFSVVRQTLTMFRRALAVAGAPAPLPWAWNSAANTDPLDVHAHGLPDTMNAYYSRTAKALKFGHFIVPSSAPPRRVFTCRSFDIVAHETGHAVLDGLKPNWILSSAPPQTGGLHESFGDLTAIFLALSQLDQVEAVIAQTRANLHDKSFLSDLAEEFGLALGRANGLRNADNNLKLSEVSTEVHAISQVFTGAIYDILADLFALERRTPSKDDAAVLYDVSQYLLGLVLRALIASPASNAQYADVANKMISIATSDGKPASYRNAIRNRFVLREVVVAPVAFAADADTGELVAANPDTDGTVQDRSGCCGTLQHEEYLDAAQYVDSELAELKRLFAKDLGTKPASRQQPGTAE